MTTAPLRRRLRVICNPRAGRFRPHRFARALETWAELGCVVTVEVSARPGHATALAAASAPEEWDAVVAAGGDGTINEVANGLVGRGVPLAVLPMGTANVLALELGLPRSVRRAARIAAEGTARRIHLGEVADGESSRHFMMMAGAGFDAHVVAAVDPRLKAWLGKAAYLWEILRQMRRFSFPGYVLRIDGGPVLRAGSVIVANGRHYGGRMVCAPEAALDRPRLEVCLLNGTGPWAVLRHGVALGLGLLARLPDVRLRAGREIRLEGPPGDPVQADGEIIGRLPATIRLSAATLEVIGP